MSQSESRRVAHYIHVEIELKKKKKKKRNFDSESLVLQKFRKITAISQPRKKEKDADTITLSSSCYILSSNPMFVRIHRKNS